MALFTVNFQFGGTTAVAQVKAASPQQAAGKWIAGLNAATIPGLGTKGKTVLAGQIRAHEPLPVRSVENVWCVSVPVSGLLALVYLTQTVEGRAARKVAPGARARAAMAKK